MIKKARLFHEQVKKKHSYLEPKMWQNVEIRDLNNRRQYEEESCVDNKI